ncbi:hypothetical protein HID58_057625 [Brassica napus]|uniref:Uncharacterized protein n=1 Tax=Brassica napus TaxID=3708 RepID=A0ABQ8ARL5_BRANA|nr:hypothetical protein HID58_057625 [Brassica napus]
MACAPAEQGAAGDGEGNVQIEGNVTVNFSYHEAGEHKQALVKLVTCERCAEKLYYKRRKDAERSESKEKKRQRRKRNRSSSEDDIEEEERRKGKKNKSKLEGCEREGKDDENFDEFMEGMFPGKARDKRKIKGFKHKTHHMELPVGHVVAGVFFLLICLWHSFNNIKLFRLNPNTFSSSHGSLSPSSALHNSSIMIVRQLVIGPKRHQPFDPDAPLHRPLRSLSSCFSYIFTLRQHELGRTISFALSVCHFRFPHHHSNGYCHATKEQIDGVYSEKVDYSSPV